MADVEQPIQPVERCWEIQRRLQFGPGHDPAWHLTVAQGPLVEEAGAAVIVATEMQHPSPVQPRVERMERISGTVDEIGRQAPGWPHGRC